jgi:hypothetical protein
MTYLVRYFRVDLFALTTLADDSRGLKIVDSLTARMFVNEWLRVNDRSRSEWQSENDVFEDNIDINPHDREYTQLLESSSRDRNIIFLVKKQQF